MDTNGEGPEVPAPCLCRQPVHVGQVWVRRAELCSDLPLSSRSDQASLASSLTSLTLPTQHHQQQNTKQQGVPPAPHALCMKGETQNSGVEPLSRCSVCPEAAPSSSAGPPAPEDYLC